MGMTFYAWMAEQTNRDDTVGDLAADMAQDVRLHNWLTRGEHSFSLEAWRGYLRAEGACLGAMDALEQAYAEWSSQ